MSGGPTHAPEVPAFVTAEGQKSQSDPAEAKFERERAIAENFEKSGSSLPSNLSSYASAGHHNPLSASEALIAKNLHLRSVKTLTEQFGGRIVDVAENSVIVELTAKSARVEAFLSLMRPFGVLEAVRSGKNLFRWLVPCPAKLQTPFSHRSHGSAANSYRKIALRR
jgi:acetolactate synthase-1/3 small subunit